MFGFFSGFFGGFVLFAVTKFAFDWKFENFGFDAAIFFTSIFGSAVGGAIGCGMVAHRLLRPRRQG